ncbi:MAG: hypothetical protein OEY49_18530, partial [Candidatus Heimdallarchaeota archaeon]|nr:hypothetical protein [Candidatus Heimdallarchaeota archaeon]
ILPQISSHDLKEINLHIDNLGDMLREKYHENDIKDILNNEREAIFSAIEFQIQVKKAFNLEGIIRNRMEFNQKNFFNKEKDEVLFTFTLPKKIDVTKGFTKVKNEPKIVEDAKINSMKVLLPILIISFFAHFSIYLVEGYWFILFFVTSAFIILSNINQKLNSYWIKLNILMISNVILSNMLMGWFIGWDDLAAMNSFMLIPLLILNVVQKITLNKYELSVNPSTLSFILIISLGLSFAVSPFSLWVFYIAINSPIIIVVFIVFLLGLYFYPSSIFDTYDLKLVRDQSTTSEARSNVQQSRKQVIKTNVIQNQEVKNNSNQSQESTSNANQIKESNVNGSNTRHTPIEMQSNPQNTPVNQSKTVTVGYPSTNEYREIHKNNMNSGTNFHHQFVSEDFSQYSHYVQIQLKLSKSYKYTQFRNQGGFLTNLILTMLIMGTIVSLGFIIVHESMPYETWVALIGFVQGIIPIYFGIGSLLVVKIVSISSSTMLVMLSLIKFIQWRRKRGMRRTLSHLAVRRGKIPFKLFMQAPIGMQSKQYQTHLFELMSKNLLIVENIGDN